VLGELLTGPAPRGPEPSGRRLITWRLWPQPTASSAVQGAWDANDFFARRQPGRKNESSPWGGPQLDSRSYVHL